MFLNNLKKHPLYIVGIPNTRQGINLFFISNKKNYNEKNLLV